MDRKQIIDALKTLQTCCESHERKKRLHHV